MTARRPRGRGKPRGVLSRWLRRLFAAGFLAFAAALIAVAAFIGVRCYSSVDAARSSTPADVPPGVAGYARAEAFTYLTLPEWFIVYSADDYATFIQSSSPSSFPFLTSAAQYWRYYDAMCQATRDTHPFETGYHVMLGVIGASFTAESVVKSAYENTVGRFTAWLSSRDTSEDRFAARVAREYGQFMHRTPWYEFPFASRLRELWTLPASGSHTVRRWERRMALSAEYGGKALYGWLIGLASRSAYGAEPTTIHARVIVDEAAMLQRMPVTVVTRTKREAFIVQLPRYEAFTPAALATAEGGAQFIDIAGNDEILATVLAPRGLRTDALRASRALVSQPLPIDATRSRIALRIAVNDLRRATVELRAAGATVEHLYDY